jgi:very-short-patch-repair endonuclease
MQVKDLDGNLHTWNLTGRMAYAKFNKSELHLRARMLLNETYPTLQVLEEVPMTLKKGVTLYMDFYLPLKKMCVEVHGEQHYKFVQFYHQNMVNFVKAQKRDREKEEWCEINGIRYIALPFDQTDLQWKDLIINE